MQYIFNIKQLNINYNEKFSEMWLWITAIYFDDHLRDQRDRESAIGFEI